MLSMGRWAQDGVSKDPVLFTAPKHKQMIANAGVVHHSTDVYGPNIREAENVALGRKLDIVIITLMDGTSVLVKQRSK